jgi:hypothetical protein
MHANYVVYANALSYVIACIVFLYMKIFVCLIKQASLLSIVSKFGGGGVDNSILWLSFAQQRANLIKLEEKVFISGQGPI